MTRPEPDDAVVEAMAEVLYEQFFEGSAFGWEYDREHFGQRYRDAARAALTAYRKHMEER